MANPQEKSSLFRRIISSPTYIKEKWEHDRYCNGEGEILVISQFAPFGYRYRPCRFCRRLELAKARDSHGSQKHQSAP